MRIKYIVLIVLSASLFIAACIGDEDKTGGISFDSYKIAEGFEIQLAAAEPLIEAPVAIDFDNKGRMWVVEMRGFMPNLKGIGDDAPNGRISILEDANKDGVAERATVFLDSLVLPRALAHVYGGILYTAPPNLWFVEIKNDKPGKKILVDSTYSAGGSPEAQANGLMMNVDNWIYSAYSNFRYQLKNGKWMKEPTEFRGQFGISHDNVGRLYYNYNELQLAGDYVLPNVLIENPYYKPKEGINKELTENQRVYPLHATTVNRGYSKGVLDKDSMLLNVTAACGPVIYRGNQFPEAYNQNAFVCEPQANVVKRNLLQFDEITTTATQAWNDRDFIASTDEGFRPVNLSNGPDGALYVVDMHRGVMEYRAFATPYYNSGIEKKKLDTLLNAGRILRIVSKAKKPVAAPDLSRLTGAELVAQLKSNNGWIRDKTQQLLIYKKDLSVVAALQQLALDPAHEVTAIHALHTLAGLNALSFEMLTKVAAMGEPMLTAHALLLLKKFNTAANVKSMAVLASDLHNKNNGVINLYLAASLGPWNTLSAETFLPLLQKISALYTGKAIYQEAVMSSLKGSEEKFQAFIKRTNPAKSTTTSLDSLLVQTVQNKKAGKKNSIFVQLSTPIDSRTNGLALFRTICAACHGADGDGMEHIAPPLKGSEYVEGSSERLAMIILNGMEGPFHMKGQLYKFNGSMPNFGNNYNDKQIEDIIRYLRNAYVTGPTKAIKAEDIKKLRSKKTGTLKEKDLLEMAGTN